MRLYPLLRPLLFALDAERAHRATIAALKLRAGTGFTPAPPSTPPLATRVAGLDFPNPVGLAAGFDKDAEVPERCSGSASASSRSARSRRCRRRAIRKPRLFRLAEDRAVINRMGFNNGGQPAALRAAAAAQRHLRASSASTSARTRTAPTASPIMSSGVRAMAPVAAYLTINISSPNTPGLRALQDEGALDALLAAVQQVGREARRSS